MHIIYKYAKKCGIDNTEITEIQNQSNIKLETITPYKQALFIDSISPYEWQQQDQLNIFHYGLLWNNYMIIRDFKHNDAEDQTGKFYISFNEDKGICSLYNNNNKNYTPEDGVILDLNNLINYLKNLNYDPANIQVKPNEKLTSYNVKKLIRNLQGIRIRKQERFNTLINVFVTFGFPATHYYINNQKTFNPEKIGIGSENSNVEELDLGAGVLEESLNEEQVFKLERAIYQGKLINLHGEGAGIILKNYSYHPIQPIEIAALIIKEENVKEFNQMHWNIGTVKWLKYDREGQLTVGIEIFAPFAIAAAIKLIKDANPMGYFQRAFLFSDNQNKFNIITPNIKFETNKQVKIYSFYHKEFVETKLKEELTTNNNFKCFAVDVGFSTKIV